MTNHCKTAGNSGKNRMYARIRNRFNWHSMSADAQRTIKMCAYFEKIRLKFCKKDQFYAVDPRGEPLVFIGVDTLGPLPQYKSGERFVMVVCDSFSKLAQAIPLRKMDSYTVARALVENWIFIYGTPETVLTDNGAECSSNVFDCLAW